MSFTATDTDTSGTGSSIAGRMDEHTTGPNTTSYPFYPFPAYVAPGGREDA